MYLYGASGHAKVIMDVLQANGQKIEGLVAWKNKRISFDYQYWR